MRREGSEAEQSGGDRWERCGPGLRVWVFTLRIMGTTGLGTY